MDRPLTLDPSVSILWMELEDGMLFGQESARVDEHGLVRAWECLAGLMIDASDFAILNHGQSHIFNGCISLVSVVRV